MYDVDAQAPYRLGNPLGIGAAREQRTGCRAPGEVLARSLDRVDIVAVLAKQDAEVSHRALFASRGAVAVVEQQDAHR
jgi:hypothetical protein